MGKNFQGSVDESMLHKIIRNISLSTFANMHEPTKQGGWQGAIIGFSGTWVYLQGRLP
jgi:hypothetical protein